MNFSSPDLVDQVVRKMQETSWRGDNNMAKINSLFNGDPPWTQKEAKRHKVQINVPSTKCPSIMDNARGQWETAFTSRDKFFRAACVMGDPEMRHVYSMKFTRNLARVMKKSKDFLNMTNEVGASVMLHGRGPLAWENEDKWCPEMVGLGDLKIPARTLSTFKNLGYYGIYRRYTPFTLFDSAFGDYPDKRWNKTLIKRILAKLKDVNSEGVDFSTWEFPAEIVEDFKSNSGYWSSDAVPVINCWDFYFRADEGKGWERRIILDRDNPSLENVSGQSGWIYNSAGKFADSLEECLQVIYANGCHVAPFRYHSVRGLGYRLYDEGRYEARAECRLKETVLQEMMWVFSNVPAEDRERVESFWLSHMGVLPPGVKWVPANERYRPDLNLIMAGLNQSRQLMSESSTSYVMDMDGDQSNDRETATKTMARMQQANSMIGNFLVKAYEQWRYVGKEIVRRFLRKNSLDPEVKEFWKMCQEDEIPSEWMVPEAWEVEPERVAGNGNRMLAAAMADRLMLNYNRYDPQGQKIVLRIYVDANTDDPDLGDAIAPMGEKEVSSTVVAAYRDVGSLMQGLPAPMDRKTNQPEYIETLLKALGALVQQVNQSGGVPDQKTLVGLGTMGQEIGKRIQLMEQDPGAKEQTKMYQDALGQLMNQIKAFAQRLQEQAKKRGQGLDPEVLAKIQGMGLLAQTQAKIKEATAQQRLRHKQIQFVADQRRKDLEAVINAHRQLRDAAVSAEATDLVTRAKINREHRRTLASLKDDE